MSRRKQLGVGCSKNKRFKKCAVPFTSNFGISEDHFQNPNKNHSCTIGGSGRDMDENFGSGRIFGRLDTSAVKQENIKEEENMQGCSRNETSRTSSRSFGHGSNDYINEEVIEEDSTEDSHLRVARAAGKDRRSHRVVKESPPPWLKGKAIGLWYRDRYRKARQEGNLPSKKERREMKQKMRAERKPEPIELHLEESKEKEIRSMLNSIKSDFPYPIQKSIPRPKRERSSSPRRSPSPRRSHSPRRSASPKVIKKEPEDWTEVKYKQKESGSTGVLITEYDQVHAMSDKYKHLQESAFKRKFLRSITGSIEENLQDSLCSRSKLKRNPQLDEELKRKLLLKTNKTSFIEMLRFRKKLPAFDKRLEILNLLDENQIIVISGETGCGKTTQVAQFILDGEIMKGNGSVTYIVCTQPRRISAVSVAERVAEERGEICGNGSVGYQIRLEKQLPEPQGSILYCTTGVLLQMMTFDLALRDISHVILDEIHERDTVCDFVMAILKDVIPKRPDLKVILMSATLNADSFSKYFNNCPMLHIPGLTYPVKQYYLEDVYEMLGYFRRRVPWKSNKKKPWKIGRKKKEEDRQFFEMIGPYIRQLKAEKKYSPATVQLLQDTESEEIDLDLILALIEHICRYEGEGAILVFLPGWDKISALNKLIQNSRALPSSRTLVIPLHSMMPTITQKSVFNRPPPGKRKIVIATNIAETSITIDDVVFVVDCGKTKMQHFDLEDNISTLKEEWVSLANTRQRKGRAGRVQEGICYHLFTRAREQQLASYPLPQMLRTRLEEVILQAKMLQVGYITPFLQKVMDPPNPKAIQLSLELLLTLNALDEDENLTPLGYHLAKLPLDPQTGKLILMGAMFSCVDPIFSVAASLSFKDAFVIPLEKEHVALAKKRELAGSTKSDHLALVEAIKGWEIAEERGYGRSFANEYFLSNNTLELLCGFKEQFAENLFEMKFLSSNNVKDPAANLHSNNIGLVKAIICAGLYPNVAIIKHLKVSKKGQFRRSMFTPEDGAVKFHIKSVNDKEKEFESRFFMYHLKLRSSSVFLHDTTMVFPLPLLFFGQKFEISIEDDEVIINVSKDIRFTCLESTALLIKELRQRLDWLLEQKVCHPAVTNWSHDSDEGILLRAIIKLISYEERQLTNMYDPDYDSESNSDDSD